MKNILYKLIWTVKDTKIIPRVQRPDYQYARCSWGQDQKHILYYGKKLDSSSGDGIFLFSSRRLDLTFSVPISVQI